MISGVSRLNGGSPLLRCRQVVLALPEAPEKLVTFAAAANEDVLVFKHRFDDAEDRFRTKVVGPIEAVHGLEDFFLGNSGVFEGALLKAVGFHEARFVLAPEPAVEPGLLKEFRARVGRGEADLDAEQVEVLGEADG